MEHHISCSSNGTSQKLFTKRTISISLNYLILTELIVEIYDKMKNMKRIVKARRRERERDREFLKWFDLRSLIHHSTPAKATF